MLYSVEGKRITKVPHSKDFKYYFNKMNKDELNLIIENEKIFNSSYLPPKHWKGSVFNPIYELIQDKQIAAFFMGNYYGNSLWTMIKNGCSNRQIMH